MVSAMTIQAHIWRAIGALALGLSLLFSLGSPPLAGAPNPPPIKAGPKSTGISPPFRTGDESGSVEKRSAS